LDEVFLEENIVEVKKQVHISGVKREDLPYIHPLEKNIREELVRNWIKTIENVDLKPTLAKIDKINEIILNKKRKFDMNLDIYRKKIDNLNKNKMKYQNKIKDLEKKLNESI